VQKLRSKKYAFVAVIGQNYTSERLARGPAQGNAQAVVGEPAVYQ
jgi:hypothetical protein